MCYLRIHMAHFGSLYGPFRNELELLVKPKIFTTNIVNIAEKNVFHLAVMKFEIF